MVVGHLWLLLTPYLTILLPYRDLQRTLQTFSLLVYGAACVAPGMTLPAYAALSTVDRFALIFKDCPVWV